MHPESALIAAGFLRRRCREPVEFSCPVCATLLPEMPPSGWANGLDCPTCGPRNEQPLATCVRCREKTPTFASGDERECLSVQAYRKGATAPAFAPAEAIWAFKRSATAEVQVAAESELRRRFAHGELSATVLVRGGDDAAFIAAGATAAFRDVAAIRPVRASPRPRASNPSSGGAAPAARETVPSSPPAGLRAAPTSGPPPLLVPSAAVPRSRRPIFGRTLALACLAGIVGLTYGFTKWFEEAKRAATTITWEIPRDWKPSLVASVALEPPLVLFNGKPVRIGDRVPAGKADITINDGRFLPYRKNVDVRLGNELNLGSINLAPAYGSVEIRANPSDAKEGLVLFIDGKKAGLLPCVLDKIAVGKRRIEVQTKDGRHKLSEEFELNGKGIRLKYIDDGAVLSRNIANVGFGRSFRLVYDGHKHDFPGKLSADSSGLVYQGKAVYDGNYFHSAHVVVAIPELFRVPFEVRIRLCWRQNADAGEYELGISPAPVSYSDEDHWLIQPADQIRRWRHEENEWYWVTLSCSLDSIKLTERRAKDPPESAKLVSERRNDGYFNSTAALQVILKLSTNENNLDHVDSRKWSEQVVWETVRVPPVMCLISDYEVTVLPRFSRNSGDTQNTDTGALASTVGDLEKPAGSLTLSATSSNTAQVPITVPTALVAVGYGGGRFVASGAGGVILESSDGVTWNQDTSGTGELLGRVAYGNGTFVVCSQVSGNPVVSTTSSSPLAWQSINTAYAKPNYAMGYHNGQFIGGWGDSKTPGTIATSPDGSTWTSRLTVAGAGIYSTAYGNGTYVVGSNWGKVFHSSNGITWIQSSYGDASPLSVTFFNGKFIGIAGDGTTQYTSTDGVTWMGGAIGGHRYGSFASNGTVLVAAGWNEIQLSSDGTTWHYAANPPVGAGWMGITYGAGKFVVVSSAGGIYTSIDGEQWSAHSLAASTAAGTGR